MKFDFVSRLLAQSILDDDQGRIKTKFLNTALASIISILGVLLLYRLVNGVGRWNATNVILAIMLVVMAGLFRLARRGYVMQASVAGILVCWLAMTFQAWINGGVKDVAVFAYIIIILMAGLLTSWQFSIFIVAISIASIWGMAIYQMEGKLIPYADNALHVARDLTGIFVLASWLILLVINTLRESREKTKREFAERLRAEQALRDGEERFRRVFDVSPVAIVVTTLHEGRLINANDAYWKLSGHDPRTAIGKTTTELRRGYDTDTRREFVDQLLEKKSIHDLDYDFVNDAGEHRSTMAFYELINLGDQPAILSMFYDLTEQINARRALQLSEARARALLDAIPDAIFEIKRDGTILQFIPSTGSESFLLPGEFVNQNITQVLPFIVEQTFFSMSRALESGQVNAFEWQFQTDRELKTFEARVAPVGADTALIVVRDVSLYRWAESEREKLVDELEAKNAELERFTYTVSHDLKSPLITIKGFLGYIMEDVQTGNMTRLEADVKRINDAAEKMQDLLRDLLELSRVGRLINQPEKIPFNALVADALELAHGRISQRGITVHVDENLPYIYGDRQRLLEVLLNLIDNAAKFMGDQPEPCIEIGLHGDLNGMPIFYVRDNGIGIAPKFKDKVFGLFDKLNAQSEGTGIGLALVKRIIEFHNGMIWVESESGNGATFFFTLPTGPASER